MKLHCHRIDNLPRMAWCAKVCGNSGRTDVFHGPWVLTSSTYFAEGAWDSPPDKPVFDQSSVFMGSGGKLVDNRIVFVSPCHNLESIVLIKSGSSLFVSNSLVFLLIASGLSLDPDYPFYQADFWSSVKGLDHYIRKLPTREGPKINVGIYLNLVVDSNLLYQECSKPEIKPWPDFESYHGFLSDKITGIVENATDKQRTQSFDPLTTISSGYDSPAATVLAKRAGCRHALTFDTGIEYTTTGKFVDDSGSAIARRLGLSVDSYNPKALSDLPVRTLAEFAACGDTYDLQFSMFENRLPASLLFTGHPGGFWKRSFPPTSRLVRTDPAGSGLTEFRLRVGFIHLPIPLLGAEAHPSLHAISNSKQMKPWSVGGNYDRPVPRRIVEQAGIPRSWFGQSKKGSFNALLLSSHLFKHSPEFTEYKIFLRHNRTFIVRLKRKIQRILIKQWLIISRFCNQYLRINLFEPRYLRKPKPGSDIIVQWGVHMLRERYEKPMSPFIKKLTSDNNQE